MFALAENGGVDHGSCGWKGGRVEGWKGGRVEGWVRFRCRYKDAMKVGYGVGYGVGNGLAIRTRRRRTAWV